MKTSLLSGFLCLVLLITCESPPAAATATVPLAETEASVTSSLSRAPGTTAAQVRVLVVSSTSDDDGRGSLRSILSIVRDFDVITFDTHVFPPDAPATIPISSELPHIRASNVTLDASNAGVILDGGLLPPDDWIAGLQIVEADFDTIMGLQISNFPGPGIAISGDSRHNVIGGDRSLGDGPFGQGNLITNNAIGIDLSTSKTMYNTITGNLIGTDAHGADTLGNERSGVFIEWGARDNIIGPDNTIAHNGESGIFVQGSDTLRNTITQNSITGHSYRDIVLEDEGNAGLAAPAIYDFDLAAGTLDGVTCSDCTVEVFSDDNTGGAVFEAQTTADSAGVFTVDTGSALTGPGLTATATDPDGNTSVFSLPTSGTSRSVSLQGSNDLPRTPLLTKPSSELDDNRIAAQFDTFALPEELYDLRIYDWGVTRARVAITSVEPERVDWSIPEVSIDSAHDDVFARMEDNGLIITYMLTFWDKETYPGGEGAPCARFKTEEEIEHYLQFVQFTVNHFKDSVEYYEIWNEPELEWYCPKWIELEDYINLVERTVPVIRQEYPEAKIVVGSVSNTAFPWPMEYLMGVLNSDIISEVDVIAWHPMYGTSPEDPFYRDYYYEYPDLVQTIKDTAAANNFKGEFQADELTWSAPYNAIPGLPWVFSPTVANKYFSRAAIMHLGMDVGVGLGRDYFVTPYLSTVMAGVEPVDFPIEIQSSAEIVSYTFRYPNGDRMVALWTNGVAVDNDPGVEAHLILPSYTASEAVGIDILNGFEQELLLETTNGDTVISHLLIRDYPILIRLSGAES